MSEERALPMIDGKQTHIVKLNVGKWKVMDSPNVTAAADDLRSCALRADGTWNENWTAGANFDTREEAAAFLRSLLDAGDDAGWVTADKVDDCGWWWHWNGDEDCCGNPVWINASRDADGEHNLVAAPGQLGWAEPQPVIAMGGLWCPCVAPPLPSAPQQQEPGNG